MRGVAKTDIGIIISDVDSNFINENELRCMIDIMKRKIKRVRKARKQWQALKDKQRANYNKRLLKGGKNEQKHTARK